MEKMSAPLLDFAHYQDVLFTSDCILQLGQNSGGLTGNHEESAIPPRCCRSPCRGLSYKAVLGFFAVVVFFPLLRRGGIYNTWLSFFSASALLCFKRSNLVQDPFV